jgi:alanine dehydrogenase
MIIGVPREIKREEHRVGITPSGVREVKKDGHVILVESGAGTGSGVTDDEYLRAGADIVERAALFEAADLIVKVKEPLQPEYGLFRDRQALFTFLHLAANRELAGLLLEKNITALGYETLEKGGMLPLLSPMSEIAGRMAPIMGAYYLQRVHGGTGFLPTGAVGVKPAKAVILGAGVVGTNAARVCEGLGMDTTVINRGTERLQKIDEMFMGRVKTLPLTSSSISGEIANADIVICAMLVPGGKTPVVISKAMLRTMRRGAVIVDVSVDQGGCAATSRPTTHDDPVYDVDGIIHYTVANMPGAYPGTSTLALTNATLPYIRTLANKGIEEAIRKDSVIRSALNTYNGTVTNISLADSLGLKFLEPFS